MQGMDKKLMKMCLKSIFLAVAIISELLENVFIRLVMQHLIQKPTIFQS